jgi:lysophospholipase L1-like esterase
MGPFPATPEFSNQTIHQVVRVSLGGSRFRLRLTNEYGTKPLEIGAVSVARVDEAGAPVAGSERAVSFAGRPGTSVPAHAAFLSDPIDLPLPALASLSIRIYVPEATGQCTCHATGLQTTLVSDTGDFTARPFTPARTLDVRAFISGVEVDARPGARAVVVLGDSISDGLGSTLDANRRWPDLLANRLNAKRAQGWGVVNMGISGNRVLSDGAGQSALARFDRDVLATPGVQTLILLEGTNDLGISYGQAEGPLGDLIKSMATGKNVTADAIIDGYRQLIARAHAHRITVFIATIIPYGRSFYYSADGEAQRQAINAWIRTSREADGVLDFDAVVRDPAKPNEMKEMFRAGDFLHGNDAGYAAMAESVDLALFK